MGMAGGEQQLGEQHARISKILWAAYKKSGVKKPADGQTRNISIPAIQASTYRKVQHCHYKGYKLLFLRYSPSLWLLLISTMYSGRGQPRSLSSCTEFPSMYSLFWMKHKFIASYYLFIWTISYFPLWNTTATISQIQLEQYFFFCYTDVIFPGRSHFLQLCTC